MVHESALFFLNYFVEHYMITPILLYYANDMGSHLVKNEILMFRILFSVIFWGGIAGGVYGLWWATRTLIEVKSK